MIIHEHAYDMKWVVIVNNEVNAFEKEESAREFYENELEKSDGCDSVHLFQNISETWDSNR